VLTRLLGLFVLVMFFWAIFDQGSSTWIFFAQACMDCRLFGQEVDPDQIQTFNPLFIVLLLPPITVLFGYLNRRGVKIRPTDKMIAGFLLTAVTMGVMTFSAWRAGPAESRPYSVRGEGLTLTVEGGKQPIVVKGDMSISMTGLRSIVVKGEDKKVFVAGGESQAKVVKKDLEFTTEGDKRMAVAGDLQSMVLQGGKVTQLEDAEGTLAEGDLQVRVTGPMKVHKRWFVDPANQVSVWWQVFAYLLLTIAEILISVTGLELAYTAAPKTMTGFVTGCWWVTVGMGNLVINAPITRLYPQMQPQAYFGMLAGGLLVVAIAFTFVARQFNRSDNGTPAA
jgi:dipeptide/tripeptide permease